MTITSFKYLKVKLNGSQETEREQEKREKEA